MNIYADNLENQLQKGLLPLYLVSGDELLICEESCNAIRKSAKKQGHTEHLIFDISATFKWDSLTAELQNQSLFDEKRLIELRIPTGTIGKQGASFITNYCKNPYSNTIFLLHAGKLTKGSNSSLWYKSIDRIGGITTAYPIDEQNFPKWLMQRLKAREILIEKEALYLFCSLVQGNLMAAAQEIYKLEINNITHLTVEIVESRVADNARYTPVKLADACLTGDVVLAVTILQHLQEENRAIQQVYWSVLNDIRTLFRANQTYPKVNWMDLRVWNKRQHLMERALSRLSKKTIELLLHYSKLVEICSKGLIPWNTDWELLKELVVFFAKGDQPHILDYKLKREWQDQRS